MRSGASRDHGVEAARASTRGPGRAGRRSGRSPTLSKPASAQQSTSAAVASTDCSRWIAACTLRVEVLHAHRDAVEAAGAERLDVRLACVTRGSTSIEISAPGADREGIVENAEQALDLSGSRWVGVPPPQWCCTTGAAPGSASRSSATSRSRRVEVGAPALAWRVITRLQAQK